jgi:acetylornithine deacetylase/succinyl-diaminopimelate desuccinylase-like protein
MDISDMSKTEKILSQINVNRMVENLWRLVNIPSPTGRERAASVCFSEMLGEAGANVELDETIADSPNVIGHLKGSRAGRTIQLAGHIDHIDVAHTVPRRDKDIISGRGAADMKNGLAGILEIVRVLNETECDFAGEILVTVYGLHEAPEGDSRGLFGLLDKGVKGDAGIVFEGPNDRAAVMANGMAIWNLTLRHKGQACHELSAGRERLELFRAVLAVGEVLLEKDRKLKEQVNKYSLLPAESLFVGQLHYGDFYNRLPDVCTMQGTRRWHPDKSFDEVKEDFAKLIQAVSIPEDVRIENEWMFVGDSYEISPDESIVKSLCRSYKAVFGKQLPVAGHNSVTDTCRLVGRGNVPTVLWGFGTETGHSNNEYVKISQLESSCKVAVSAVLDYLEGNCG